MAVMQQGWQDGANKDFTARVCNDNVVLSNFASDAICT